MTENNAINPGLKPINFLLVGVGGQGTILASNILAELGMRVGYDVKQAEVHGMSQRGGSVVSNMRWAPEVFSPIIARGEADILIAFEKLEAARFSHYLRPNGIALINDYQIVPVTVSAGTASYPEDDQIRSEVSSVTQRSYWVNGVEIAEKVGNPKTANIVVLGSLSALLNLPEQDWLSVLEMRVPPKYLEINRHAFQAGRQAVLTGK